MGNILTQEIIRIRIWHKFSKNPPRGWPENGCLYFSINSGSTINDLLDEINRHRRPKYNIKNLLNQTGTIIDNTSVITSLDFYV